MDTIEDPRGQDLPTIISETLDLAYSQDDGYYFHRFPAAGQVTDWSTWRDVSQIFSTMEAASDALLAGEVRWEA